VTKVNSDAERIAHIFNHAHTARDHFILAFPYKEMGKLNSARILDLGKEAPRPVATG
jgi:hypothetical protein